MRMMKWWGAYYNETFTGRHVPIIALSNSIGGLLLFPMFRGRPNFENDQKDQDEPSPRKGIFILPTSD